MSGVPAGMLTLQEAAQRYRAVRAAMSPSVTADGADEELKHAFAERQLDCFVGPSPGVRLIGWLEEPVAELNFSRHRIASNARWQEFDGQIGYLAEGAFNIWMAGAVGRKQADAKWQKRLELFERLRRGSITPRDAEAFAFDHDLGPLLSVPNPEVFNPLREARWTLGMAMEWIATRSGDAVRRQWPAYVERDQIWENILDEHHRIAGYQVTTARRPLAYYLLIGDVSSNESSHFRARDDLFREASQGRVRMYGFNGRPAGVEIPAADFQRLGISLDPQADRDVLVWRSQDGDNLGVAYTEPVVASADVIRVWPPERQPHAFAINANAFIRAANNGDDILLAEAVGWIAELHGDGDSALEAAEQALFKRLFNARTDIARGVPWPLQHGQDRISEPISFGVFEYPNQPGGPQIHYVDEMLHTEAGGVVVTSARQWNGVKVPAKWMIAQWPPLDGAQPSVKQTRSGMPGRPTSAQFLLAEFHRRREAGQLLETCAAEARHLSEWLKAVHPLEAQARPRSIENTIRGAYQAAKPIKLPH